MTDKIIIVVAVVKLITDIFKLLYWRKYIMKAIIFTVTII